MSAVFRTSDPAWDAERATWQTEPLPVCSKCGAELEDDHIYEVGDEVVCEECLCEMHHISYEHWRVRYVDE